MDKRKFKERLQSGSGKPFIYAQTNDLSPFRDLIFGACLHCYFAAQLGGLLVSQAAKQT